MLPVDIRIVVLVISDDSELFLYWKYTETFSPWGFTVPSNRAEVEVTLYVDPVFGVRVAEVEIEELDEELESVELLDVVNDNCFP